MATPKKPSTGGKTKKVTPLHPAKPASSKQVTKGTASSKPAKGGSTSSAALDLKGAQDYAYGSTTKAVKAKGVKSMKSNKNC